METLRIRVTFTTTLSCAWWQQHKHKHQKVVGATDIITAATKHHDNATAAAQTPTPVSCRGNRFFVFPVGYLIHKGEGFNAPPVWCVEETCRCLPIDIRCSEVITETPLHSFWALGRPRPAGKAFSDWATAFVFCL